MIAKADEPNPIVGLFDSDGLAGEDPVEIDLLPIEADAPAGGDGGSPVMEGMVDVREASKRGIVARDYAYARSAEQHRSPVHMA
jgi:hypothetical protein